MQRPHDGLVPFILALALTACATTDAARLDGFKREANQLRQTLYVLAAKG